MLFVSLHSASCWHLLWFLICRSDSKTRREPHLPEWTPHPLRIWWSIINKQLKAWSGSMLTEELSHHWLLSCQLLCHGFVRWWWRREVWVREGGRLLLSLFTLSFPCQHQHACLLICWFVALCQKLICSSSSSVSLRGQRYAGIFLLSIHVAEETQTCNTDTFYVGNIPSVQPFKYVLFLFSDKLNVRQQAFLVCINTNSNLDFELWPLVKQRQLQ